MKSLITLALLSLAFCGLINRDLNDYLKKHAPFEVYEPEENPLRHLTFQEMKELLGVQLKYPEGIDVYSHPLLGAPPSYDFRELYPECVGEIRNQMNCGSCWAFSGAVALEQRFCMASKGEINLVLSPQDSVSCDFGNLGCHGGFLHSTWEYYMYTGITTEECLPYVSGDGLVPNCPGTCIDGSKIIRYKAQNAKELKGIGRIKAELMKNGPIQAAFTVYEDFLSYKSGIYVHTTGEFAGGHAVVILGWGVEDKTEYWIVQNSWGADWGEKGYFRIKFGECGIDSNGYAGVPVL
ncbi:MAG: C1 family peptidase [Cetobacterium sp.]